jgi:hypothetical protein
MTDFQPIPGVWYEPAVFTATAASVYTPRFENDDQPWIDGTGFRHDWDSFKGNKLREVYNPHLPTQTEYIAKSVTGTSQTAIITGKNAESYLRKTKADSWKIHSRQVTDWVEVETNV